MEAFVSPPSDMQYLVLELHMLGVILVCWRSFHSLPVLEIECYLGS